MIATDSLSVADIRARLSASLVGRQIYLFGTVDSTNEAARRLADQGAAEGTTVIADEQTMGRGRLGRPWFSPPRVNVYASALFRPGFHAREAARFSLIAPLAVSDTIKDLGLSPAIKWPNDVLVEGRKVAGSRAEYATRGEELSLIILGVAVNLNVEPAPLRAALGTSAGEATSLSAALGRPVNRNAFAAAYLSCLDRWARCYLDEGAAPILAAWRDRDIITGRRVQVRDGRNTFEGRALGIDTFGHLAVEAAGRRHVLVGEEIVIVE
ncbi:MAG: biotin--[acetyl-CoA-carboxylase] ligase [Candidatus Rokuibacteriota bacterium]